MGEYKNLFLAIILSLAILLGWQLFLAPEASVTQTPQETQGAVGGFANARPGSIPLPKIDKSAKRIAIRTPTLDGSFRLEGAVFDDLTLREFRITPASDSPHVTLLTHTSTDLYDVFLSWKTLGKDGTWIDMTDSSTPWNLIQGANQVLTPENPIVLTFTHPGLLVTRTLRIDEQYMLTVESRVLNTASTEMTVSATAHVRRSGPPEISGYFLLHEGPIGFFEGDGGLENFSYEDLEEETTTYQASHGWLGITDKYWGTLAIPDQRFAFQAILRAKPLITPSRRGYLYHIQATSSPVVLQSGETLDMTTRFFLGPKEHHLLAGYEKTYAIPSLISLIDWGWFWFLTIPMFYLLRFFGDMLGNFGWSIVVVASLLRLAFWPVLRSSYRSMAAMRRLQPEITILRARYAKDAVAMQKEVMSVYRKSGVNPLSSLLPMLIQIPFFFALYKVLFTTIEMRQAPFWGWIKDLSMPDPLNLFTLFGILDWSPPWFLNVGLWPILMGLVMYVSMRFQQSLQTMPSEMMAKMQKMMLYMMPFFIAIVMSHFPAGLVLYSISNTLLSLPQQLLAQREFGDKSASKKVSR